MSPHNYSFNFSLKVADNFVLYKLGFLEKLLLICRYLYCVLFYTFSHMFIAKRYSNLCLLDIAGTNKFYS